MSQTRKRGYIVAAIAAIAVIALGVLVGVQLTRPDTTSAAGQSTTPAPAASVPVKAGKLVCGQPVLRSPYSYDGAAGRYSSGQRGLPTYGTPGSDFPNDTAGMVVATGTNTYASYQLQPNTVYYLLPGVHAANFQADTNDAFVGGFSGGTKTILSGNYSGASWAIDSNSTDGDQSGVAVEYLTIEKYEPSGNSAALNPDSNTGWVIRYDTITLNVPGAGVILGAEGILEDNCLTLNGQYGFQSVAVNSWGQDSLTGGPYDLTVADNEISYNDTCDFEGLLDNSAVNWSKHDPVPAGYRNSHCGQVTPDGDQGGFKLWRTDGVTIKDNYIHGNWGPAAWADTDNANTRYVGNVMTSNDGGAIIEEISYNFAIVDNYMADDGWSGLGNPGFPTGAIYVSESGSDRTFGGVPACPETSCSRQRSYPTQSIISGNTMVDNSGTVFLWEDSNRFCSDGFDGVCTMVDGGPTGPFTMSSCKANLRSASINEKTYAGKTTGQPREDWWDGCMWRTENVSVSHNVFDFDPAAIPDCNHTAWPDCGAGGIFSEYGSTAPYNRPGLLQSQLTFAQGNSWSDNTYNGPSTFFVWNQGNNDNPVSWKDWTGAVSKGDDCGSAHNRSSGFCTGPFGQDAGSTYSSTPQS